jgi:bifunctional DNA-binding transcriptional regulator/antitoxin component of YhaV-PrlF toxin-antitoxin module
MPQMRHNYSVTASVKLDASNRFVVPRDLRRAAGITQGQRLRVSATPGRLVLEAEPNPGRVVKRGNLKVWSGQVPSTPIDEAVDVVRHYE